MEILAGKGLRGEKGDELREKDLGRKGRRSGRKGLRGESLTGKGVKRFRKEKGEALRGGKGLRRGRGKRISAGKGGGGGGGGRSQGGEEKGEDLKRP